MVADNPNLKIPKRQLKVEDVDAVGKGVLAQDIVSISASMRKLTVSGLNRKAIVVLIAADTGISKKTITEVIESINDLAKTYTT